ncbi:MAG: YhbY family RNA-binding protein [Candidatus Lokiarchaeota archaeon]|nr:YhbY family RNA-binding protein [Candidatus Lokiarchaeota archaeon]
MMDLKQKFKEVMLGPPHCILGKKGIMMNEGFISHIEDLLKKNKIIKIKLLKTSIYNMTLKEIADKIAKDTNSYLLDIRGRTLIISKTNIE